MSRAFLCAQIRGYRCSEMGYPLQMLNYGIVPIVWNRNNAKPGVLVATCLAWCNRAIADGKSACFYPQRYHSLIPDDSCPYALSGA
jgi:hypothetical protein